VVIFVPFAVELRKMMPFHQPSFFYSSMLVFGASNELSEVNAM